jgi:hypothetical protein
LFSIFAFNLDGVLASVFNPSVYFGDKWKVIAARRDDILTTNQVWQGDAYKSIAWKVHLLTGEFATTKNTHKMISLQINDFQPCMRPPICGANGTVSTLVISNEGRLRVI